MSYINIYSNSDKQNDSYGILFNILKKILNKNNIEIRKIDANSDIEEKILISSSAGAILNYKNFAYFTMWESTTLPQNLITNLNKSDFIINPSNWGVCCFAANGIRVPLYKLQPFYDGDLFIKQKPIFRREFIFGTIANPESYKRKNIELLKQIFQEIFSDNPEIKLDIKTDNTSDRNDMLKWYQNIDCYINLSAAEGIGFCLLESMACGRTVLSTRYSAPADYLDKSFIYNIDYDYEIANRSPYNNIGIWSKPKVEDIIRKMKLAAENKDISHGKGKTASINIKKFNYIHIEKQFIDILKKHDYIYA